MYQYSEHNALFDFVYKLARSNTYILAGQATFVQTVGKEMQKTFL